ncbi:MAG: DUF4296 domain-containing protein [Paludibacteraceae bacterium]|nr:DUF4296 domain-containing protein [Paludibacteraceae bacterium]
MATMKSRFYLSDTLVILAILASLTACRPEGILSRSQLEDVLVDIHAAEGVLEEAGLAYGHDEAQRGYYKVVLLKHNITQEQFDSTLVWYTARPQIFDKVYPRVHQRLTERLDAFNQECDLLTEQEMRLRELASAEQMHDSMVVHLQQSLPQEAMLLPKIENPLLRPLHPDTCRVDTTSKQDTLTEQSFFIRSCVLLRSE